MDIEGNINTHIYYLWIVFAEPSSVWNKWTRTNEVSLIVSIALMTILD